MNIKALWSAPSMGHRSLYILLPLALASLPACVGYKAQPLDGDQFASRVEKLRKDAGAPIATAELSLAELERLALLLNPALRTARLEAGVAQASADQAGRWADPVLGADAMRILRPDDGQSSMLYGASLTFTIPISGRLAVEKAHAKAEARASIVRVWSQEQELLRSIRITWATLLREQRAAEAMERTSKWLHEASELGEKLSHAGEVSTAEALAFQSGKMQGTLAQGTQRMLVRRSEQELAALVGFAPDFRIIPKHELDAAAALPTEATIAELARSNPAVLVAEADYESAEQALRLSIRKQYPDLELGPLYALEDGQNRLGLGFSLPIPILDGNRREIAEATAKRDVARSHWEETLLAAEQEFIGVRRDLAESKVQQDLLRNALHPLVESRYTETKMLLESGELNALLVLEAVRSAHDVLLQMADAELARSIAEARLQYLKPTELFDTEKAPEASK